VVGTQTTGFVSKKEKSPSVASGTAPPLEPEVPVSILGESQWHSDCTLLVRRNGPKTRLEPRQKRVRSWSQQFWNVG